jgi:ELWxxDGT repeat protein
MTKAVLIHTAVDIGNAGPDYSSGWGLMDAFAGASLISDAASGDTVRFLEDTFEGDEQVVEVYLDGSRPLRTTLVWNDLPGEAADAATINVPAAGRTAAPALVNDLDLWIEGPDGERFHPWTLNPEDPAELAARDSANHLDNVEQVLMDAPPAGVYRIHIGATGAIQPRPDDGLEAQDFSLIIDGIADQSNGGTGDVISVDLSGFAAGTNFSLRAASLPDQNEVVTFSDGIFPGVQTLSVDGEVIGEVFLSEAVGDSEFASTGQFHFIPEIGDGLSVDADESLPGFQGILQVDYSVTIDDQPVELSMRINVQAGFQSTFESPFQIRRDPSTVNQLRLEHRLAFLGFRDADGDRPIPDGVTDPATQEALRSFQSTVDPTGRSVPFNPEPLGLNDRVDIAGAQLTALTVAWLNSSDAPRWLETTIEPGSALELSPEASGEEGERFAADWLLDILQRAAEATREATGRTVVVDALSAENPLDSHEARSEGDYPGRLHTSGLEVALRLPDGAVTGTAGQPRNADEDYVVTLVQELLDAANSREAGALSIGEISVGNEKLISDLRTEVLEQDAGDESVVKAAPADQPQNVIYLAFVAPQRPSGLSRELQDALMDATDALSAVDELTRALDLLNSDIPLVSPSTEMTIEDGDAEVDPEARGELVEDTGIRLIEDQSSSALADMLELGELLEREVQRPIAQYLVNAEVPSAAGLAQFIADQAGPLTIDAERVVETVDRIELPINWSTGRTLSRSFDLEAGLADLGVQIETMGDFDVALTAVLNATLIVDLTRGLNPLDVVSLQVTEFSIDAAINAAPDLMSGLGGLDLAAQLGFLGVDVTGGSVNLSAGLDLSVNDGAELTLRELTVANPLDIFNVTPTSHLDVSLPFDVTIGGDSLTAGLGLGEMPRFVLSDSDLFDLSPPTPSLVLPPELDGLQAFQDLTAASVNGLFGQVEDFFGDLRNTPAMSLAIPFTDGLELGDAFGFVDAFRDNVTSLLTLPDAPTTPSFGTVQELGDLLPSLTDIDYLDDLGRLELTFEFGASIDPISVDADLSLINAAPLANVETFGDVELTAGVDAGFKLVIDLSEIGGGVTVNGDTPISALTNVFGSAGDGGDLDGQQLNDGYRFDNANSNGDDADLTIMLQDGTSFDANFSGLSSASSLQQVATAIAANAPVDAFVARVDSVGKRLVLEDRTLPTGPEAQFRVRTANGSMVGLLLGVVGGDDDNDGVINGSPLHGDSLSQHAFLEELPQNDSGAGFQLVTGQADLTAQGLGATAQFGGLVCLNVGFDQFDMDGNPVNPSGSGSASVDASLTVNDPTTGDLGLTLDDLLTLSTSFGDGSAVDFDLQAAANFDLSPITLGDCAGEFSGGLGDALGDDAGIAIDWPEIFLPRLDSENEETGRFDINFGDLDVQFTGFDGLSGFGDFDSGDVLNMLRRLADFVGSLSGYDFLNLELPGIGRSLGDLFDLADRFRLAIEGFESDPDSALGDLEFELNRLLGPDFGDVDLSLDTGGPVPVLRFDLPYRLTLAQSELETQANEPGGFAAGDTELTVESVSDLPDAPFSIQIDDEVMLVTAVDRGTKTLTVERGAAAVAHAEFETVHVLYELPLDFSLRDFGIDLGDLVDFRTGGQLLVTGGLALDLAVGIEIAPGEPVPFLIDDGTRASATFEVNGTDLRFETTIGPFGVLVGRDDDPMTPEDESAAGRLVIDNDGAFDAPSAVADPVGFVFNLTDPDLDNRHSLAEAALIVQDLMLDDPTIGGLAIELPLFCADGTPMSLDPNAAEGQQHILTVSVSDLTDSVDTFTINPNDFGFETIAACFGEDFSLGDSLEALIAGLDGLFGLLEDALAGQVFGVQLPLIGNRLRAASDFIGDLRRDVIGNLEALVTTDAAGVRSAVFQALGPLGLGWLRDINGDGSLDIDDVLIRAFDLVDGELVQLDGGLGAINAGTDTVQFDISLGSTLLDFVTDLEGDLGIPALGFNIDGMLNVSADFEFDLGFGVSLTDGVFFNVADPSELQLSFDAEIMELAASANLGPLQVDVRQMQHGELTEEEIAQRQVTLGDAPNQQVIEAVNAFRGAFIVNVGDPNNDGRLALDEFGSLGSVFSTEIAAVGSLDLDLMASLGGDARFPSIGTELHAHWNPGNGGKIDLDSFSGVVPEVSLDDVELNLGEFFTNFFGPTLETLQTIVAPVQPLIDILTARLPVISDLTGERTSLLDLAVLYGPPHLVHTAQFIEALDTISDLLLPQFGNGAVLALGGFSVTLDGGTPEIQLDDAAQNYSLADAVSALSPTIGRYFASIPRLESEETPGPDESDGMFGFPILERPSEVFNLLLGLGDPTLVTYDIPDLDFEFMYRQFFPIIGPLGVSIGGALGAHIDFKLGFDTKGLREFKDSGYSDPSLIFDGLYLSDTDSPDPEDGEEDVNEVELTGSLTATAELNLGIARGGVEGGIFATIGFNLHDNDGDGKVRVSEILDNAALGDLGLHVFDVGGTVETGLSAFVEVDYLIDTWRRSVEIAPPVTLLDFEIPRPSPPSPPPAPTLAHIEEDGTLVVHVGDHVGLLGGDPEIDHPSEIDGDDNVALSAGTSAGQVVVSAFGLRQTFDASDSPDGMTVITRILVESGAGNDSISASSSLRLPLIVMAGEGDDRVMAGGGPVSVEGEGGKDFITGGAQDDTIDGGAGDDVIVAGIGNDIVIGGLGNDAIDAGPNDDTVRGAEGDDTVVAGRGDDCVFGGLGNDSIDGGSGADTVEGEDGNDATFGGQGQDVLRGGAGSDTIEGGIGNDEIDGGADDDTVDGGLSNDEVRGGDGNDRVLGGPGADTLNGGLGNDVIVAGITTRPYSAAELAEIDALDPSAEKDRRQRDLMLRSAGEPRSQHSLTGGEGDDTIHGDLGPDEVDAGPGANVVFTYAGNDVVRSGDGDDDINVGDGTNTVRGGAGSETVTSGSGDDDIDLRASSSNGDDTSDQTTTTHIVLAGAGNNLVYTDAGDDSVTTLDGDDTVHAGDGDDTVIANAGNNLVTSGAGDDFVRTLGGADTVRSGAGADDINVGAGDDNVDAGVGNDVVFTELGDDTVNSGDGDDVVFLAAGDDVAFGGPGNDLLVGSIGDDFLDGGAGVDIVWGGAQIFEASSFDLNVPSNFVLPPEFAANEALTPTGFNVPLITPAVVGGRSLSGTIEDGEDTLRGGDGTDFLCGGGLSDDIDGGNDADFIDGGSGPETIHGGGGDDVIFGGDNDDNIFGDAGIDQIYGNAGDDLLRGDAGDLADGSDAAPGDVGSAHILAGQRLYGNEGNDVLYAFAPSPDHVAEGPLIGDQLFGGPGTDRLLGNIRSEVLSGGSGNENIAGDALAGPEYGLNLFADSQGGHDTLRGDGGEDCLQGGGGDDVIFGGANSDFLEGQGGSDVVYGGLGIDFLKLDTPTGPGTLGGDVIDGHFGDRTEGDRADDNATDILLVEGTDFDDSILLRETQTGITSDRDLPADALVMGQLSGDAVFSIEFNGVTFSDITVATDGNMSFDQLVADIDNAVTVAVGSQEVRAIRVGSRIRIQSNVDNPFSLPTLKITAANSVAANELGLAVDAEGVPLLDIEVNGNVSRAEWRAADGQPLVEQFQVNGLGGDDEIGFEQGQFAVSFGDLSERSRDWVGVFNGGSGDDILLGADGRDRLDGGRGSDLLVGGGGDDRLFGDTGNGSSTDLDVLFAGAGNDDLIGGLGRNRLYSWSYDPSGPLFFDDGQSALNGQTLFNGDVSSNQAGEARLVAYARQSVTGRLPFDAAFGLSTDGGESFVDVSLNSFQTQDNLSCADLLTDLNFAISDAFVFAGLPVTVTATEEDGRLVLSTNEASLTFRGDAFGLFTDGSQTLSDDAGGSGRGTGSIGGAAGGGAAGGPTVAREDTGLNRMLGQSRVDRLYGGMGLDFMYGNGGEDLLFTRDGELFETGFDVPAGDEWKAYARSTDSVWYYGGTNSDDVISVDYVTEPGLLVDHHLITRLTENNGNFTFDASVRLDFNATDENGDLVWDATDLVADVTSIVESDPEERQMAFDELVLNGNLLPSEDDFLAIIVDALGGNDVVNVGPTVQKTVWVDAGAGDDTVTFQTGTAILVDRTEEQDRNEVAGDEEDVSRAFNLFGPSRLIAVATGPVEGQLSGRARFDLSLNGADSVRLELQQGTTDANATFDDLIEQINALLDGSDLSGLVRAVNADGRVAFEPVTVNQDGSLSVTGANVIAAGQLFLTPGLTVTSTVLADSVSFTNLTIDNPGDIDWYAFQVAETPDSFRVDVSSLSENDDLDVQIVRLDEFGRTFIQTDEPDEFLPNDTIKPDRIGSLLIGQLPPASSGVLEDDVTFVLRVNDADGLSHDLRVTVTAEVTAGNFDVDALAIDLQEAIDAALVDAGLLDAEASVAVDFSDGEPEFMPSPLAVSVVNGRLAVSPTVNGNLTLVGIDAVNAEAVTKAFGFVKDQTVNTVTNAFSMGGIAGVRQLTGASILGSDDTDFFRFSIDDATSELDTGVMTLDLSNFGSHLRASLFSLTLSDIENKIPDDPDVLMFSREVGNGTGSVGLPLGELDAGEYLLKIEHVDPDANSESTRYELNVFGYEGNSAVINVAGEDAAGGQLLSPGELVPGEAYYVRVKSDSRIPTVYDLTLEFNGGEDNGNAVPVEINFGRQSDVIRRDVILGGPGHDRLQGGPGEDWIFGGDGNDVLTGGTDQQASDLLFGGPGDDLFQIVPDDLPTNEGGQTILTTQSDRFDGGEGFDQVLFLGGDYDRLSRPVPDHVAISFNRFLQRYEFTSLEWDIANQQFVTTTNSESPATIESTEVPGLDGQLSGSATFDLSINGDVATPVTIPADSTNGSLQDLAGDINAALRAAGVEGQVFAVATAQGILLSTTTEGFGASLELSNANAVTTEELYLANSLTFGGQRSEFRQLQAYYQAFNTEGTLIDTRAGDDEVHADPEYRFPLADGSGFTETEYGIKPGNFQEGATLAALRVEGGDGNDRLFGGVLNDTINGGAGADFIAGSDGDDVLKGGAGFDLIVGQNGLQPDSFEAVARDGEAGFNDLTAFASPIDIDALKAQVGLPASLNGLTLNLGDGGDWYAIPVPAADSTFGVSEHTRLLREQIRVTFDSEADQALFTDIGFAANATRADADQRGLYFLFGGVISDPQSELSLLPVDRFSTVPGFYLLHVVNPLSLAVTGSETPVIEADSTPVNFRVSIDGVVSDEVSVLLDVADSTARIGEKLTDAFKATTFSGSIDVDDVTFATVDTRGRVVISLRGAGEIEIVSTDGSESVLHFQGGQNNRGPAQEFGTYRLTFDGSIGQVVDVPTDDAALQISSTTAAEQSVFIPLGDLNFDSTPGAINRRDYIVAVQDARATVEDLAQTDSTTHPHERVGSSFARLVLGRGIDGPTVSRDGATSIELDNSFIRLELPAPVLNDSFGVRSHIASGDFNGDGIDDLAVLVATVETPETGTPGGSDPDDRPAFSGNGLYVVYGQADCFASLLDINVVLDVVAEADVTITGFEQATSLTSPGNVINAGGTFEDLVIGQAGGDTIVLSGVTSGGSLAASSNDRTLTGIATVVASVGDVTGTDRADWVAVTGVASGNAVLHVIAGTDSSSFSNAALADQAALSIALGNLEEAPVILPAGDVDGDGTDDFLVQLMPTGGAATTRLYLGGAFAMEQVENATYFPLGDIDSSGRTDIARVAVESYDATTESGDQLFHTVFEVFIDPGELPEDDDFSFAASTPRMIVETGRPQFSRDAGQLDVTGREITALGDLNDDGIDDFAIADRIGAGGHAFFGQALDVPLGGPFGINQVEAEPFEFDLATPRLDVTLPRQQFDLNDPLHDDILTAPGIDGSQAREQLSRSQAVGDFNGDGFDDFLLVSETRAALLLRPVKLNSIEAVDTRAEILSDLDGGWSVARGAGDLTGDGHADLAFFRDHLDNMEVFVIPGTQSPQRFYAPHDGFRIATAPQTGVNLRVSNNNDAILFDYDGNGETDLLLVGDQPVGPGGNIGMVYFDAQLQATEISGAVDTGDPHVTLLYQRPDGTGLRDDLLPDNVEAAYTVSDGNSLLEFDALDLNGDGADEIVVTNRLEHRFTDSRSVQQNPGPQPTLVSGTVYVVAQETPGGVVIVAQPTGVSRPLIRDFAVEQTLASIRLGSYEIATRIGSALHDVSAIEPLGDINNDGREDFALLRGYETHGFGGTPVQIYFGQDALVPGGMGFPSTPDRVLGGSVLIRQYPSSSLPTDHFVVQDFSITAGDFDGNGQADIAVGLASFRVSDGSATVEFSNEGRVDVFYNAAFGSFERFLTSTPTDEDGDGVVDHHTIIGPFDRDGFGGDLSSTSFVDLNRDGFDDLLIGASDTDSTGTTVVDRTGSLYAVYGTPRRHPLPDDAAVEEIANRTLTGVGDVLLDPGTGRPVVFQDPDENGDGILEDSRYTLPPQSDRWYRFRFVGDGAAHNSIRLSDNFGPLRADVADPIADVLSRSVTVRFDLYDENGGILAENEVAMDLRHLQAGTYFLRIHDTVEPSNRMTPRPFVLEIRPPAQGQFHQLTDNDLLRGGEGNDILIGGPQLDRLFGETGNDLFLAEAVEVRDAGPFEPVTAPSASDRLVSSRPWVVDPEVDIPDAALRQALSVATGIPLLPPTTGQFVRPLLASDLSRITRLDLAGQGVTDLTGLEYAMNLRTLNLSASSAANNDGIDETALSRIVPGTALNGDFTGLFNLETLILDGTQVVDFNAVGQLGALRTLSADDVESGARQIDSLVGLDQLPFLQLLSVSNARVSELSPLNGLEQLGYVDLSDNRIADVSPLSGVQVRDDGDDAASLEFLEQLQVWHRNQQPVPTAFRDDYRIQHEVDGPASTFWILSDISPGEYDVYATWHSHSGNSSDAQYTVFHEVPGGTTVTVNQRIEPRADLAVDNRPFQLLGALSPAEVGQADEFNIQLEDTTSDGPVVADAIIAVRRDPSQPELRQLNLAGNPLNENFFVIDRARLEELLPGVSITFDANSFAPETSQPYGPQYTDINTPFVIADVAATFGLTDDTATDFSFSAATSSPSVSASFNGSELTLTPANGFTGVVSVQVTMGDDPDGGREVDLSFDLNVGVSSIYGTKFFDEDEDNTLDAMEVGIENVQLYFDTNNNDSFDAGIDPVTFTDANGDYVIPDVAEPAPAGARNVREILSPNSTTRLGLTTVTVDDANPGVLDGEHIGNFIEVDAGTDRAIDEGNQVTLTANVLRDNFIRRVSLINPGADAIPSDFAEFNGELYFAASGPSTVGGPGRELYRFDGNAVSLVEDINPGNASSNPSGLTVFEGKLYFAATHAATGRELYEYDGTTFKSYELNMSGDTFEPLSVSNPQNELIEFNGKLYFAGEQSAATGIELFSFDPASGIKSAATIEAGPGDSRPGEFAVYDGALYFAATTSVAGRELYQFDGSTATQLSLSPGAADSNPTDLTVNDGVLYFAATSTNALSLFGDIGTELFALDGTSLNAADLNPGTGSSAPTDLAAAGGVLFFAAGAGADGSFDRELHFVDQSAAQSGEIVINSSASVGANPSGMAAVGSFVYFAATGSGSNTELWRAGKTGPEFVADVRPGAVGSSPRHIFDFNGSVVFSADDGSGLAGEELHRIIPASDAEFAWTLNSPVSFPATGVAGLAGRNLTFTAPQSGAYVAEVTVTIPGAGLSFTDSVTVFAQDMLPTLEAGSDEVSTEGRFTRSLSGMTGISDPGADEWTVTVDYGDGSPLEVIGPDDRQLSERSIPLSHAYADPGAYTVTVFADNDELPSPISDSFVLTLGAAAPIATISASPSPVFEGEDTLITVTIDDPTEQVGPQIAEWSFEVDWGDGIVEDFRSQVSNSAPD